MWLIFRILPIMQERWLLEYQSDISSSWKIQQSACQSILHLKQKAKLWFIALVVFKLCTTICIINYVKHIIWNLNFHEKNMSGQQAIQQCNQILQAIKQRVSIRFQFKTFLALFNSSWCLVNSFLLLLVPLCYVDISAGPGLHERDSPQPTGCFC